MSEGNGGPPIPNLGKIITFLIVLSCALPTIYLYVRELIPWLAILLILLAIVMGLWKRLKSW